jgi:ribosomal-protein-alanine N-acetyltransferase
LPAPSDRRPRFAPLDAADAEAVSALHARCFEVGWSAADFRRLALEPHCCGITAWLGDAVAGFVIGQTAAGEAEILTIAVAPECRRSGLGAGLLMHLAEELARRGAVELFLEVGTDNPAARALYAKAGFAQAGRRRGYYRTSAGLQDALILRRPLAVPRP